MPEGPEIRRAADEVEDAVINKFILKVTFGLDHLQHWEPKFIGVRVNAVETYGKAMLTHFNNGLVIYSHNQLYGRWICCPAKQIPDSTRQLRLGIYAEDQWALLYSASSIEVLREDELLQHHFIKKLGRDVLKPEISTDYIVDKLLSNHYRNRQIGGFLTEQSFVAGLGNYLRCEILFIVGLNPASKPSTLNRQKVEQLASTVIDLPRQSYKSKGITNDLAFATKLIEQGKSFEDARFWVFRREGLTCYRCGNIIIKKKSGGQACYYCPVCQST